MANFINRLFKGELGSKTLLAALALLVLVLLKSTHSLSPDQFESWVRVAEALGLVGLRDAISKLPK